MNDEIKYDLWFLRGFESSESFDNLIFECQENGIKDLSQLEAAKEQLFTKSPGFLGVKYSLAEARKVMEELVFLGVDCVVTSDYYKNERISKEEACRISENAFTSLREQSDETWETERLTNEGESNFIFYYDFESRSPSLAASQWGPNTVSIKVDAIDGHILGSEEWLGISKNFTYGG